MYLHYYHNLHNFADVARVEGHYWGCDWNATFVHLPSADLWSQRTLGWVSASPVHCTGNIALYWHMCIVLASVHCTSNSALYLASNSALCKQLYSICNLIWTIETPVHCTNFFVGQTRKTLISFYSIFQWSVFLNKVGSYSTYLVNLHKLAFFFFFFFLNSTSHTHSSRKLNRRIIIDPIFVSSTDLYNSDVIWTRLIVIVELKKQ